MAAPSSEPILPLPVLADLAPNNPAKTVQAISTYIISAVVARSME